MVRCSYSASDPNLKVGVNETKKTGLVQSHFSRKFCEEQLALPLRSVPNAVASGGPRVISCCTLHKAHPTLPRVGTDLVSQLDHLVEA